MTYLLIYLRWASWKRPSVRTSSDRVDAQSLQPEFGKQEERMLILISRWWNPGPRRRYSEDNLQNPGRKLDKIHLSISRSFLFDWIRIFHHSTILNNADADDDDITKRTRNANTPRIPNALPDRKRLRHHRRSFFNPNIGRLCQPLILDHAHSPQSNQIDAYQERGWGHGQCRSRLCWEVCFGRFQEVGEGRWGDCGEVFES